MDIPQRGDEGSLKLSEKHIDWLLSSHRYSTMEGLNETIYSEFV